MFFIVRKQEQLYKHLLTTKLFIMNKRFFTLMAAALLAGAPFAANEAFAATGTPTTFSLSSFLMAKIMRVQSWQMALSLS